MFSAVVAFAFRLINLCALVFLAVYVFKKYLLNSLEDAVSEQEAFETGLKQQQGMLESRLDEGKQEQRNLEKQCMLLKSKVDQWHINFKANEEKLNQTKKQILEQMAQRTDQQTMQLAQQTLTRLSWCKRFRKRKRSCKNIMKIVHMQNSTLPQHFHY